jgi:cyclopropane fatty-acyl-phospholipid synthase-like methyltransferase
MSLDLYAKIEQYLDFSNEVYALHNAFLEIIITKELNNILDIGCGQGNFLQNLLINNINCFGIDLSKEQIAICKAQSLPVESIDLCELNNNYDCLTAIFDVLNYIPQDSLESFLKCAYDRLNDKGYFIFDVNSYFGFDEIAQGTLSIDLENKFINIDAIFQNDILETKITLFEKNGSYYNKEQSSIKQYYHSNEFLTKILKTSGFKIEKINDFHLHSSEDADKQIWICTK